MSHAVAGRDRSRAGTSINPHRASSTLVYKTLLTTTTVIRILVVLAAAFGGGVGAFVALVKLVPERSKLISEVQVAAISTLQGENKRLMETVGRLENDVIEPLKQRVKELEEKL